MRPLFLHLPGTASKWLALAKSFDDRWTFPHCIGAIDGKHVNLKCLYNSGSHFYNYKKCDSIVLLAIAGPGYEIVYADMGTNGRISDGGVFNKTSFLKGMCEGTLKTTAPNCLPKGKYPVPYVVVGDDAFTLRPFLMKPYAQALTIEKRMFKYRLSRARRISENACGILSNRWRVYHSTLEVQPKTAEKSVLVTLVLHKFLLNGASKNVYSPTKLTDYVSKEDGSIINGTWRDENPTLPLRGLRRTKSGHRASNSAKDVRDILTDYFFNEGAVPWQWNM